MLKKILAVSMILIFAAAFFVSADDGLKGDMEILGKKLFFDKRLSTPRGQACAVCHGPDVGWTGPESEINALGAVYPGAIPERFGNRKPPSSAYATLSPLFDYNTAEDLFFGGNFWDGRATGWDLGNPAADQARGPFLNPVEQNNPDKAAVVEQVCRSNYADLFLDVAETLYPGIDICADVDLAYDLIALAIADFEDSKNVNRFSSKYDAFIRGKARLTPQEMQGMKLFNGRAQCAACHPGPLFTDFTYDNLGTPKNPDNPFYHMDTVFLDSGEPINPEGSDWIDPGLGGFLIKLSEDDSWRSAPFVTTALLNLTDNELASLADANYGKHKVPTLRNVGKRPSKGFVKAYMHNGVFKSLKAVVNFYNKRDEMIANGTVEPEVIQNMNITELGNLGLSDAEEDAIVTFMETLSDGWESDDDDDDDDDGGDGD